MDKRTICNFVNSKDIRKHLLDTGYDFTAAEAAWLVYRCVNCTFDERIDAWTDIINTMPDQQVDSGHFEKPYESLHDVLKKYLDMQNCIKEEFMSENSKAFYQHMIMYNDYRESFDDYGSFSTLSKCYKDMMRELGDEECDDIAYGCIRRLEIDSFDAVGIEAYYNYDGKLTRFHVARDYGIWDWHLLDFFDDLWFHFPVPYKKGDILYDPFHPKRCDCPGPVVMDGITPLLYEEDGRTHTDSSDMNVWGYFQDEESGRIYHEVTWNYMDYEYYPSEKLVKKKRILKALSNFIKGEIDIVLLLRAYDLIILDETKNDLTPRGWFTDEGLILAGLMEESKKEL